MNAEEIKLVINPIMETGDVKRAVDQIEGFFNKMNLSGSMKSDVAKIFKDMRGEAESFERASKEAFKTPGEVKNFEKSGQKLSSHFEKLVSIVNKLGGEDLSKLFTIDDSKIAGMTQEVTKLQQKINNLSAAEFDKISNSIKQMHSVSKSGNIDTFLDSLKSGNFSGAENALKGLIQNLQAFKGSSDETRAGIELMLQSLESGKIDDLKSSFGMLQSSLEESEGSIKTYAASLGQFINLFSILSSNGDIQKTVTEIQQLESGIGQLRTERVQQLGQEMMQLPPKIQKCNSEFDQMSYELTSAARRSQELNREISELGQRATYFLSLENSVDLFRQGVRKAIETVKELDKAMTETAVVTDFSIGDMWERLPEYTKMANELGVATQGVYEASTLYYQQGLQTEEVMALTAETLKMARIAGLECADATNLMTAALRGFNMEINEASAQRVNDVYSELAAITAADTNEIATAMTKTASIAASANMELETTAALLAQMIETTREPAETAGTAMKTIIARFTEMKKATSDIISVDGEEVSVNKVDAALASVGVSLKNAKGEFRDLDDVFIELASKWNSLDMMSQRYIATMAAGSRQQSRFIAMMSNYDRTLELVNAAYSSAGASSTQFEKTQESLESKLARLQNAWNTFLMGIADDQIVKGFVDLLTKLLEAFNKITERADGLSGSVLRLGTVFAGLRVAKGIIDKLIVSFVKLKNGENAIGILQGLTQKITNFKTGKGFVLDVDLNTRKAQGKLVNLKKDLTGLGKAAGSSTGSWATGFSAMSASLGPILKPLLAIAAVLGVIAATCAIIYNTSPLKSAKNEADMARSAVEDYNRTLEETNEEAETLNNLMDELSSRETTFDNLIVGSLEWYEAIAKSNEELIKQIDLLKSMGYNINYSYDKNGLAQVDNIQDLKQAQKEIAQKQIELQKSKQIASYTSDVATLKESFAQENADQAWNDTFKAQGGLGTGAAIGTSLLATGGILSATGVGIPIGGLMAVVGSALALGEAGTIIDSFLASSEASGTLTDEQKRQLEEQSKLSLAGSWGVYAEDEKQKKAGQKVISNMDNVYDTFYSTEAFEKKYKGYKYDLQGNPELTFSEKDLDIKEDDLTNLIKDLGYTNAQGEADWNAAATALGLKWDEEVGNAEGLYTLDKDGNKQYFDVSNHGTVDTAEQWASLIADPNGGAHIGDSKNIDAGFLAYKLAESKRGQGAVNDLSSFLDSDTMDKVLYGTDNWGDHTWDGDIDENSTEMEKAVAKATLEANRKRRQTFNELYNSAFENGNKVFGEEDRSYMGELSGYIQRLSVDTNETTARAYQAFVTQQQALVTQQKRLAEGGNVDLLNRPEINASKLAEKGWEDAGDGFATVFTNTFSKKDWDESLPDEDNVAMNFTPILPDGSVLSPSELEDYAYGVINGIHEDNLGLQIGAEFKGENAIQEAVAAAEEIHQLQEAYYSTDFSQDKASEYYELFSKLNLEDATASLETLNQEIAKGSEEAKILKENLTTEGSSLDISNQFSDLIKSGVLDEISEDISKLSDEAGNIDVTATRELIDENKELKNIMDEFNVSGYAMGKILTDIQNGELSLIEVNEGLIESYKLLYSAMGQAEDVLYDLRNADLGEDYTEIGRTYGERYNTAKDLYKRGAYGSENFAGNIKSLIGDEEWQSLLNENGGSTKTAYEKAIKKYHLDKNKGNLYGSFSALISENATDDQGRQAFKNENGTITYDFSEFKSYDDILDHMVSAFGISREYAKAMLADMSTYSDTLQSDLNNLNVVAAANKNYQAMYFEEAKDENGNPILDKNNQAVMNAYTSQTDAELAAVYGQTEQWSQAETQAKSEYETENQDKKWDDLTEEERQEYTTSKFKDTYNIKNTIKDENGEHQITKVDSYGNKYYKDKEGKTKIQDKNDEDKRKRSTRTIDDRVKTDYSQRTGADGTKYTYNKEEEKWKNEKGEEVDAQQSASLNADAIQSAMASTTSKAVDFKQLAEEAKVSTKDAIQGIQEIANDPVVMQMATELNSEEYDAWLAENYGENAPEILISAGFDQNSIAGVAAVRDEMIAQIQGVAQALETLEVTIPIKMPALTSAFTIGTFDIPINMSKIDTEIVIGGEGTSANFTSPPPSAPGTSTSKPVEVPFTPKEKEKPEGTGYVNGDDPTNDPNADKGGGGSDSNFKPKNYVEENSNKQLEALDRVRQTNDREAELIEKLPEEIQFPLKMANLGEDMLYEYQEIQINKNKQAALQNQLKAEQDQAKYYGEYYYYDEFTDAYMYDVEKMESDDLDDEKRQEIEEEISNLQEINDKLNAVEDELDGGKIQKVFRILEKATDGASKALKKEAKAADLLEEEFGDLAKQFGLDDELKKFGDSIDNTIKSSKLLNKSFEGLGIVSEETLSKLDKLPIGDNTKNLIKNTLGKNEGGTIGSVMGDMFGASSDMFGSIGDILNFDMMSMGLDGMNMMKDMGQKMIQYVVQFVQTIINWWINREDWLYNLLSAIEQEVRNFNRQSEVEERFRLYSDEGLNDLVSAWEAMRASLEKQIDLNEQLIESRQAELQFLNMTNLPFAPAFYYDYAEERVIENPWVYDIYVLLLDLGSAIPEFGQIFSSIKQLMEDNKKRMEDAVQEIEDARDKILELEKQQLELRTKYMEDEIELEELVMDTIIEKQQEQIDELSTMNEAIEQGNEKLIQTLNDNLDRIRQQRENQDKEEELAEKERRLAYLRQDTSNANRAEIMNLQEELKNERRDYTDELIDQKISELEKQNELAAEQRQKQIDLLQSQLDYTEKYGLQWAEAQTLIKNGFDSEGRLRVGTDLYNMLMSKEDFTSMGLGSTRQTQQIMDWNVTSIAAAAFREINDIWEEGFGNFEMSNDVHDQSRLHLWEDRQVDYYQLPSWLSFLQPAANTIQDYLWRTGNNISAFVETGFLSGKNSSSILGKTVVPLLQGIYKAVVGRVDEYNSLNEAETGGFEEVSGAITQASDNLGYGLGEKLVNGISNAFASVGGDIVNGFTNSMSNYAVPKTQTQTTGNFNMNFYINSEDREEGLSIGESVLRAFREGISNLSIFG